MRSRQCRLHRLRQPRGRVLAGDAEGGDQSDQQGGAEGAGIAARQTGMRRADPKAVHLTGGADEMRLPQGDCGGVGSGVATGWPIGQHGQGTMGQPGGDLQPSICRLVVRRADAAQVTDQQTGDQQKRDGEQGDMRPRRQHARQIQQCHAYEQPSHANRRP